jgi:hypothetical protein
MAPGSEEKVAFVGFPFRPAVPAEADLLGVVSAEFIAEKLAVCRTPRLHLAVHDRQMFSAKRTAGPRLFPGGLPSGGVYPGEAFAHLSSLTPRARTPVLSRAGVLADLFTDNRSQIDTLLNETACAVRTARHQGIATASKSRIQAVITAVAIITQLR